jgi:hypothetical protein
MSTPLTDAINALTTYANGVTGASDTNLSDAVRSLADGYGGGGGGYTFSWDSSQKVTVEANTITQMQAVKEYFSSYSYDICVLMSQPTTNNQVILLTPQTPYRYKNNAVAQTVYGAAYDGTIVEGTEYLLLKL